MIHEVVVGIGSNAGQPRDHVDAAIRFLTTLSSTGQIEVSPIIETDPVDCPPDSPRFLNAVAILSWTGSLPDLLHRLRAFERDQGRPESYPRNSPRQLDLDILFADTIQMDEPSLQIPHPRALQREFVMQPLVSLRPDWRLPDGRLAAEVWASYQSKNVSSCE